MLSEVSGVIGSSDLNAMQKDRPRNFEQVNYSLLSNKDGRFAWRPFQLINPALYVSLVNNVTSEKHWNVIRARFSEFQTLPHFECLSIPIHSHSKRKNKAIQIIHWWQGVEQKSIELALDYAYVLHADIADCYSAIYTHSIAWALHEKAFAKVKRDDLSLIGNVIDMHVQEMRHGQTNGIPQGSVMMDLVSEMILGYADLKLNNRLQAEGISEFHLLRYRDDYRIFVNNPQDGERILKTLSEVLIGLGLKLNTAKTTGAQSVVSNSIKPDKLAWLRGKQHDADPQKQLLLIHAHGLDYPNAGSLVVALTRFYEHLSAVKIIRNPAVLISVVTDIAYSSPRTFPVCAAIISRLLRDLATNDIRIDVIKRIHFKLAQLPNCGQMEVWLQRISYPYDGNMSFKENLCQLVAGKDISLWNVDWISSVKLKSAITPGNIINQKKLRELKLVVPPEEVTPFSYEGY